MAKKIDDRYLGDGMYASLNGYAIVLDLRGQDNTTRIVLEPEVLRELIRFNDDARSPVKKTDER